jgi:hypothetical protein
MSCVRICFNDFTDDISRYFWSIGEIVMPPGEDEKFTELYVKLRLHKLTSLLCPRKSCRCFHAFSPAALSPRSVRPADDVIITEKRSEKNKREK